METTASKPTTRKNKLWDIYQDANPILRAEIILALKKAGVFRYWLDAASKHGYNLHKVKAPVRDIFIAHMPDTAPMFGVVNKS
ncbi:hypothetical protein [Spirosoma oryzicola]|uniref:hypothetical protein n=1 Tax=Spirosoma oryzicola TaxID=2898794 RepID=UPI001E2B5363|nr:hypothetical protein [Spirosoma oryzicola]UHG93462.1 hypothetical protein LQ777_11270 [Spirosoma oryzicola]